MILRNTSATIEVTLSIDGTDTDPSPDEATVAVYREDGTELVSETAATNGDDGKFTYELTPTQTERLDVLAAEWSMTLNGDTQKLVTHHEIVGGFLCALAAIETAIGEETDASTLRALRSAAENRIEHACNVAFRPRYARDVFRGGGGCSAFLSNPKPISLIAVKIDGTEVATSNFELWPDGTVEYLTGSWTPGKRVEILYEHGYRHTPPELADAVVKLAASYNEAATSQGISRFREDDQEFWLTVPGVAGVETSIPEVNAVIEAYRIPLVG